jgi:MFS transporter, SP family, sugar:H+ symporter
MAHGGPPIGGGSGPVVIKPFHARRVYYLAGVAALGGFLFGFDSAVINGAVDALQDKFDISDSLIGFVVAIALLGSAVGAWYAGTLANKYGRRPVMIIAACLFFIAALGQAFPFSAYDLMFWRFLGGAGIGIASVVAPMYIAEVAPAHLRGRLGSLQQLAIVTGIFTSALTNYVILQLATSGGDAAPVEARTEWLLGLEAWQWMFLIMIIPALVYGGMAFTLPESPRYLVSIGKLDEATDVLSQIYVEDQRASVEEIRATVIADHKPSMKDLRGHSFGLLPIVWIGILLSVFQQFVGINVIFYYSNTIWGAVGFGASEAFLITLITNTTNVIATFVAIALVDRIGRKPLLLIGSAGMVVTLATMAIVFGTADTCTQAMVSPDLAGCMSADDIGSPVLAGAAGTIAVIAANAYVVFFGISWGPVVWVLLGEMFPNSIRAAALAIAAAAQWIANFLVTTSFPPLSEAGLGLAYSLYAVMALLSFVFVSRYVKETKGRSLEEISASFAS